MPSKSKQHEEFVVLITGDTGITESLLKQCYPHVVLAKKDNAILNLIKTTYFDLILLSFTENSSELFTHIKSADCINSKTPVIAVINLAENTQKERMLAMGFDDCLVRPVTTEQIIKLAGLQQKQISTLDYIQTVLGKAQNNRQLTLTIFNKLFDELPSQIASIKDALENKHYAMAQEITHKLNGSASFCGLTDIQRPANALETCLINRNYESINPRFLVLQQSVLDFISHQKSIQAHLDP